MLCEGLGLNCFGKIGIRDLSPLLSLPPHPFLPPFHPTSRCHSSFPSSLPPAFIHSAVADYQNPGVIPLQFDSISNNRTVRILIIDDSILENNEDFFGNLVTNDSAVTLGPDQAMATIIEVNDSELLSVATKPHQPLIRYNGCALLLLTVVTIGFQPADYTLFEFEGTATLTAMLFSGELDRNLSVDFATIPGTAAGTTNTRTHHTQHLAMILAVHLCFTQLMLTTSPSPFSLFSPLLNVSLILLSPSLRTALSKMKKPSLAFWATLLGSQPSWHLKLQQ